MAIDSDSLRSRVMARAVESLEGEHKVDDNRFFKFVWRFNGIAIMVTIIIGIVMMFGSILGGFWKKDEPLIANVANDPDGQEKWRLGYAQKIRGRVVVIPLVSEREYVKVGVPSMKSALHSYGDSYSGRNMLFIDGESNKSKWLFPTNNQMITSSKFLPKDDEYKNKDVNFIVYEIVTEDTNGDKKLTSDDMASIAVSSFDGSHYQVIASKVDRLIDVSQVGKDRLLLVYQKNKIGYSAAYSLADFSLIDQKELPKTQ